MKLIAGSILVGLSLVAEVLNQHLGNIAHEIGFTRFGTSGPVFLIWLFMAIGMILLAWGIWEMRKSPLTSSSAPVAQLKRADTGWKQFIDDPVKKIAVIVVAVTG